MGSSPDDAALDWMGVPVRTPGNDKQASSVLTFGGPTRPKKPVRRCFKSRPPLRTRCAGSPPAASHGCKEGRDLQWHLLREMLAPLSVAD